MADKSVSLPLSPTHLTLSLFLFLLSLTPSLYFLRTLPLSLPLSLSDHLPRPYALCHSIIICVLFSASLFSLFSLGLSLSLSLSIFLYLSLSLSLSISLYLSLPHPSSSSHLMPDSVPVLVLQNEVARDAGVTLIQLNVQ